MTLDRFTVFAAVAKQRNVTCASEQLHISQPAVTKQLKLLERDYNLKLYKRIGRGIELTETGQTFLKDIRAILKRYERLKEKFGGGPDPSGVETLAVGGSYSPSVELLPSLLATFEKSHPHIQIDLRTNNKAAIERMILNSEVDVAVVNNALPNRSLTLEPYRREPVVAFVSRNHPLAKKRELTWHDLKQAPLIIRKPVRNRGTAEQLLQKMRKSGLKLNIAVRCDSPEMVKAAVKRKMGMGILFRETVEPEVKKGEFKIIKLPGQKFEGQSFIAYRKDRPLSTNAQDFLNLLRERKQRPAGRLTKTKLPENLTKDI